MALAEGLKRFWKTPVNAPWENAQAPIFMEYGYDRNTGPRKNHADAGKQGGAAQIMNEQIVRGDLVILYYLGNRRHLQGRFAETMSLRMARRLCCRPLFADETEDFHDASG